MSPSGVHIHTRHFSCHACLLATKRKLSIFAILVVTYFHQGGSMNLSIIPLRHIPHPFWLPIFFCAPCLHYSGLFFNLCEVLFTLSLIGKGVPSVRCSPSPWKNVQAYTNITLFRIQKILVWQNLVLFQDSKYVLTKFKCKITNNQY